MHTIEKIVHDSLEKCAKPLHAHRFLVACSGGKDSVALFHILLSIQKSVKFEFAVFHLDHGLRDREGARDAASVASLCREFDIEFFDFKRFVGREKMPGESVEEAARRIRYSLLEDVRRENRFSYIITAHTLDDQIETVIYRMVAGTGMVGLAGMTMKKETLLRPMLSVTTGAVLDYLKKNDIPWNEDSTNLNRSYARNRIRHEIIPVIERGFPGAMESLVRLSSHAASYRDYIRDLFNKSSHVIVSQNTIRIRIGALHPYEAREFVRFALRHYYALMPSTGAIEELFSAIPVTKTHGLLYRKDRVIVRFFRDGPDETVIIEPNLPHPDPWQYDLTLPKREFLVPEAGVICSLAWVSDEKESIGRSLLLCGIGAVEHLSIRNRRSGDRIGMSFGNKKIKDIFIDRKVSPGDKERIPLVVINSVIAAVLTDIYGYGPNCIAREFMSTNGSLVKMKKILAIDYAKI